MNNEYTAPEIVEIGKAEDVVRGPKDSTVNPDEFTLRIDTDLDD